MAPTPEHADHACLSCAQKKRKCDRVLPSCSSCERTDPNAPVEVMVQIPAGEGWEETSAHGFAALTFLPDGQQDTSLFPYHSQTQLAVLSVGRNQVKVASACLRCRSRKKKCDKIMPGCSRCTRHQTRCVYPQTNAPSSDVRSSFLHSLEVRGVDATVPLPVNSRPYMPMLLNSFAETFGMNPLPVDSNSLAWLLRASWIQQALADPCSFHTTLYAASAHLDAFRGVQNNSMTLYHHTMALRLLNERLTEPGAVLNESLMACIAPLVFFSSLSGDKNSSQVHKKALMQMIKNKGGLDHLSIGPFLSRLITICVLTEAIINDSQLDIPFLDIPPTPPTPPTYLLWAALRRASNKTGYYNLSPRAIKIFGDMLFACDYLADPTDEGSSRQSVYNAIAKKWRAQLEDALLHPPNNNQNNTPPRDSDAITQSCHAAGLIFWYLIDDTAPFSEPELQSLVGNLKSSMLRAGMDTWIRSAPEAHTCLCLLGAAASVNLEDRVWFSLRHGQPVICIQSIGAAIFLQSWSMYDWANTLRKARNFMNLEEYVETLEFVSDESSFPVA